MKALSVRQPWAELIASGFKTIETRSWKTKYRGPLLICASRGTTEWTAYCNCRELPKGVAVAVVNLVDCRPMTTGDVAAALCPLAPFAWVLENVRRIEPFPVKGQLKLFEVDFVE